MSKRRTTLVCLAVLLASASRSAGQAPAPPPEPKVWAVAASAGLALTSGNSDTSTVNAAYDITYDPAQLDPAQRNLVKSDALYIHGETQGVLASDRFGFNIRDQYRIDDGLYVFGQNQYLRDQFKNIDYLVAPTGGLGYKLFDTPETKLDVDAGVGVVWEKNPDADVRTSGAVTSGEKLSQKLTATTTLTQFVTALWKTEDFSDSLYTFGVGISAGVSTHTQLKVEFLDTYKNEPPLPTIKQNDIATLIAIVYKF